MPKLGKVWKNTKAGDGKTVTSTRERWNDPQANRKGGTRVEVKKTRTGVTPGGRPYSYEKTTDGIMMRNGKMYDNSSSSSSSHYKGETIKPSVKSTTKIALGGPREKSRNRRFVQVKKSDGSKSKEILTSNNGNKTTTPIKNGPRKALRK